MFLEYTQGGTGGMSFFFGTQFSMGMNEVGGNTTNWEDPIKAGGSYEWTGKR